MSRKQTKGIAKQEKVLARPWDTTIVETKISLNQIRTTNFPEDSQNKPSPLSIVSPSYLVQSQKHHEVVHYPV